MKYHLRQSSRLGNRDVNEDRIGVAESDNGVLMVVADGMGGYSGGHIASRALVDHMVKHFKRQQTEVDDPRAYLRELVSDAHLAVIKAGNEQNPPIEPRTTCVICLVQSGKAWWAHVGDSRLYWFRAGKVLERTIDHSKIEEMRRKGELSDKEMDNHPQRHLVTRCIGFQHLPPIPAISEGVDLKVGDTLLLCSDGLWGPLDDVVIGSTLFDTPMEQAVETLAYKAEFKAYPNSDNISLVAFRWISERTDDIQPTSVPVDMEPDESDAQVEQTMNELDDALGKS